jgi:Flp pilus assembly protein TadD
MLYPSLRNNIKPIILVVFILLALMPSLFAKENNLEQVADLSETKGLSELQKQARLYRNQGLELQRIGNLDGAMSLYQKATELDPKYVVAYNDSGIIYESRGLFAQAEDCYLKAIKVDPYYLSAYSNLAFLYENQRNFDKAIFYWMKRVKLGSPSDPWAQKAKQHLSDIYLMLGKVNEFEALDLMGEVAKQKSINRESDKELANSYFQKAKLSYKKGDYELALKEILNVSQIDPSNPEVEEFTERVLKRLLSK